MTMLNTERHLKKIVKEKMKISLELKQEKRKMKKTIMDRTKNYEASNNIMAMINTEKCLVKRKSR